MTAPQIIIPNVAGSFIAEEIRDRLRQGHTVSIYFGGSSMLPLIDGRGDKVSLAPLTSHEELQCGEVYLFLYNGHCVVHRLLKVRGNECVFRGDNCRGCERVDRDAVMAHLVSVQRSDGNVVDCGCRQWQMQSRRVSRRRSLRNLPFCLFDVRQRRWERWLYFSILLILMWAPLGGIGIPLNNFVLGIRLDHLLHASIYLPCVFFFVDFVSSGKMVSRFVPGTVLRAWLCSLLLALVTETVQYILPYRGFDINDMVANTMGVTLGAMPLFVYARKRRRIR